jgi:hypothetical protein
LYKIVAVVRSEDVSHGNSESLQVLSDVVGCKPWASRNRMKLIAAPSVYSDTPPGKGHGVRDRNRRRKYLVEQRLVLANVSFDMP